MTVSKVNYSLSLQSNVTPTERWGPVNIISIVSRATAIINNTGTLAVYILGLQ